MSLNVKDFKENMPTSSPISVIYDATDATDSYGALVGFIGGKQAAEWNGQSKLIFNFEALHFLLFP